MSTRRGAPPRPSVELRKREAGPIQRESPCQQQKRLAGPRTAGRTKEASPLLLGHPLRTFHPASRKVGGCRHPQAWPEGQWPVREERGSSQTFSGSAPVLSTSPCRHGRGRGFGHRPFPCAEESEKRPGEDDRHDDTADQNVLVADGHERLPRSSRLEASQRSRFTRAIPSRKTRAA